VVLLSGQNQPDGGKSCWGSGFLPTIYQGVQFRSNGDPVLFLSNPDGVAASLRFRRYGLFAPNRFAGFPSTAMMDGFQLHGNPRRKANRPRQRRPANSPAKRPIPESIPQLMRE
jgi:hypothetical protein